MQENLIEQFSQAAGQVGAVVHTAETAREIAAYIKERLDGALLVAPCPSLMRSDLVAALDAIGAEVVTADFREQGATAVAGVTGANFGIAETGTVVLESTSEAVRISSMLPEKHFVVLDPAKLVADAEAAVPLSRQLHEQLPQAYLAYLTGPSRTADIERVLTIGVHGPRELHILLTPGLSDDCLEN